MFRIGRRLWLEPIYCPLRGLSRALPRFALLSLSLEDRYDCTAALFLSTANIARLTYITNSIVSICAYIRDRF